ncbi:MAG: hypothetical protein V1684_02460 [bacterium]
MKWIIFAPVYTFFLYLTVSIIRSGTLLKNAGFNDQHIANLKTAAATPVGQFGGQTIETIFSYIIIIGFLIGALRVAERTGVLGASAAMSMVQKGRSWATGKVKRTAGRTAGYPLRPARYGAAMGAGTLTGWTGGMLKKWGPTQKWGGRLEAKAKQIKGSPAKAPQHEAYRNLTTRMSNDDILFETQKAWGARKLIAVQEAQRRNLFKEKAGTPEVKRAHETLRHFGLTEEAEKLQETRPDSIDSSTAAGFNELSKTLEKVIREGNLNLVSHLALSDTKVVEAIAKNASPKQIEDLRGKSKQHEETLKIGLAAASIQSAVQLAAKGAAATAADIAEDDKIQFAHASQSGDISRLNTRQKAEWAPKAGAEGLKRITIFDATVSENIPANKLRKIIDEIQDGTLAAQIVRHIKATPGAKANSLVNADPYLANL